jgi:hypothetical protein
MSIHVEQVNHGGACCERQQQATRKAERKVDQDVRDLVQGEVQEKAASRRQVASPR